MNESSVFLFSGRKESGRNWSMEKFDEFGPQGVYGLGRTYVRSI